LNLDYYEVKAYSASAIKAGAVSMLKMQEFMTAESVSSAAMLRGTMQHMAVLEPEAFNRLHVEDHNGATKAGKELIAIYGKEGIIKPAEHAQLIRAREMVLKHPEVVRLDLFQGGAAEVAHYWNENGIDCKCKVDYETPDYFIEYKTTGNLAGFMRSAAGMKYQLQLGWYWHGCGRKRCYVVAQEQKAPFDVAVFEVSAADLNAWYMQALEIALRFESGDRSGAYPALMTFELPGYVVDVEPESGSDEVEF